MLRSRLFLFICAFSRVDLTVDFRADPASFMGQTSSNSQMVKFRAHPSSLTLTEAMQLHVPHKIGSARQHIGKNGLGQQQKTGEIIGYPPLSLDSLALDIPN
jgi:hypothetical protein